MADPVCMERDGDVAVVVLDPPLDPVDQAAFDAWERVTEEAGYTGR